MGFLSRGYLRWLLLVLWMGVIYLLSAQSAPPVPRITMWGFPISMGAVGHMVEYAILAVLGYAALGSSYKQRAAFSFVFLLALLYAILDEFHQSFVPNRDPSLWDVGLDILGAALGLLLVKLAYPFLKREGKS